MWWTGIQSKVSPASCIGIGFRLNVTLYCISSYGRLMDECSVPTFQSDISICKLHEYQNRRHWKCQSFIKYARMNAIELPKLKKTSILRLFPFSKKIWGGHLSTRGQYFLAYMHCNVSLTQFCLPGSYLYSQSTLYYSLSWSFFFPPAIVDIVIGHTIVLQHSNLLILFSVLP